MNMPISLLNQIAECFCYDDGGLPSIAINGLSSHGLSAIYAMLRKRSKLAGNEPFLFYHRIQNDSVSIDSVPDAAALVVEEQADAFHFCIEGVIAAGVELPILGIFVFPDGIEIDYRMGSVWGPDQIAGFFELLKDCCALDPSAVVEPAKFDGPPYPEIFARAWASYKMSWPGCSSRDEKVT
jgi:hypothetical protein